MRLEGAIADLGPAREALEVGWLDVAAHLDLVNARNVRALLKLLGKCTVVGQENQALAVEVEAADGEEALFDARKVVGERRPALGVGKHRDHALGLVERE